MVLHAQLLVDSLLLFMHQLVGAEVLLDLFQLGEKFLPLLQSL